ncbi:MAG TPA: STAS domain-containing protein [Melioribacteraceae bacterium]|nr:STAS domain-containing protein [Melioribacteraceae bacterium]
MVDYTYLNDNSLVTITFKGIIDINNASEIKEIFNKAIAESENIVINNDECEKVDLSYIQLLIALSRTAKEWGKNLKINSKENDYLKQSLTDFGFKLEEIFINSNI